jgi:vacuolar iron transporter family protein
MATRPPPTMRPRFHAEQHRADRIGWLRAAVLGANDGIISTASLLLGVAAAQGSRDTLLATGVAALVAGALSMAAGEYVSVSSQADTERAELDREAAELAANRPAEVDELAAIYERRGIEPALARRVAEQLMAHDALGAHARDELGLTETLAARPLQAALWSALSFAAGAVLPLALAAAVPAGARGATIAAASIGALALLGNWAARLGRAPVGRSVLRVLAWGAAAMATTAAVGAAFGVALA